MWKFIIAALIAGAFYTPLAAQNVAVSLQSAVFVERLGHTGDGRVQRLIEPAKAFKRGDRVILMVEWAARPTAQGFAVTSAIPATISFEDASQDSLQVSVDGGRHWGTLGALRIGSRYATPEDVTHLRWPVSTYEAKRGSGRMTYSAIVR
ncbi:MAG: hypothetical protein P0Y56_02555 [Candidatus Andeanibacterium colombiense]|uniref:Uncharacterized protein n=1 Tax=Candidatus Andeanibacterium colombiense TaxID=3121345 RepID=A0AAJ6BNK4_9SPHN|nr:MAG: hypothetical protein P0Y56_02555 [Sphingomonadaceae bacterium]